MAFFLFMSNIKIVRGQANTVYLTLYENVTISDPKYLFSLTNMDKVKNFIAQDIQTTDLLLAGARNKFIITEVNSGAESLTLGVVNLQPEGQWNYKVYQQTSASNLVPANATSLIEEGIVYVTGNADVITYNEYTDQPELTKYYNPNE